MVEVGPEVRAGRAGRAEDQFRVVREVELERVVGEGPHAHVPQPLVELDEQRALARGRLRGGPVVARLDLLAQRLRHVLGELVPQAQRAALLVLEPVRARPQLLGHAGLADEDLEAAGRDLDAREAVLAAVFEERDRWPIAGDELVSLGIGGQVLPAAQVRFGVGDEDAGRGAGGGTVEDAADAAVGEDVADAEFVGVVDPFDDVGAGVDAGGKWGRGLKVGCGAGFHALGDGGG